MKLDLSQQELAVLDRYTDRLEQLHRGKKFHAKQQEVIKAIFEKGYKRIFIRKGRKGGGTQTLLYPLARIAGCFSNAACYIIGPQYNLQKEIIWANNRMRNFIPKEWAPVFKEQEARVVFPQTRSFIKVQGADNYKTMVGIEGDVFIFDELKDHDPRAYQNCYPNLASRDAIWIVCGAPPANKSNFYYKLEQEIRQDPRWFFIHWSTWDNAEFLPGGREWIQAEKEQYYRNGNWDIWESEYEAKYIFGGKRTVLSAFRTDGDNSHVVPTDVLLAQTARDRNKLNWYSVFDPGFATCFAVGFFAHNPYTSEVFLLDEIYETNRSKLSVNDIWPRVAAIEGALNPNGKWRRVYDSAAPGFPQEVKARWGKHLTFTPTYKEKDDEDKYFRIINGAFATNRFFVASRCVHIIAEMENYLTDENGEYPDRDNHGLDLTRYCFKRMNYTYNEKQYDIMKLSDSPMGHTVEEDILKNKDDALGVLSGCDDDFGGGSFDLGGGMGDFYDW